MAARESQAATPAAGSLRNRAGREAIGFADHCPPGYRTQGADDCAQAQRCGTADVLPQCTDE